MKLIEFLIITIILHSLKFSLKRRVHSNLYHNIKPGDINSIIKFDPFFILLIGHAKVSLFEKYKSAMHSYSLKHSIIRSWYHFGHIDIRHYPILKKNYEIKKFPVLLHFYDGELVKKDYRFNTSLKAEMDLDLKFLHTVLELFPSLEEIKEIMKENLCTFFFDVRGEEEKHFDISVRERIEFLKVSAETIASLPRDEYQFIGIDFRNMNQELTNFFAEYNKNLKFDGVLLFSQESRTFSELSQNEIVEKHMSFFKHWIFHHSHGFLAQPELAYKNIVERKNYGLVFFHTSENIKNENLTKKGLLNFEKLSKPFKGKIQFTLCDVFIDKKCEELINLFELEKKEMPFVRILYASTDKNYRVFKLQKKVIKNLTKKKKMSEMELEISNLGIKTLITDFQTFEVDLDIKMEKIPENDELIIKNSKEILKKHIKADLEVNHILKLNYNSLKKFNHHLFSKDRIVFFYDSRKNQNEFLQFQKAYNYFKNNSEEKYFHYYIFSSYDINHNTKHGIDLDVKELPILRYYRKEERIKHYYTDRFRVRDVRNVLFAITDLSMFEIRFNFDEI